MNEMNYDYNDYSSDQYPITHHNSITNQSYQQLPQQQDYIYTYNDGYNHQIPITTHQIPSQQMTPQMTSQIPFNMGSHQVYNYQTYYGLQSPFQESFPLNTVDEVIPVPVSMGPVSSSTPAAISAPIRASVMAPIQMTPGQNSINSLQKNITSASVPSLVSMNSVPSMQYLPETPLTINSSYLPTPKNTDKIPDSPMFRSPEYFDIDTIGTIESVDTNETTDDDKNLEEFMSEEINEILSDPINFSPKKKKKIRKAKSLQDYSSKFSLNSKFSIIIENEELKKGKSTTNLKKIPQPEISMKEGIVNFLINPKRKIKR